MNHRHSWAPVCPVSPKWDRGNVRARQISGARPKMQHFGCSCGAVKTELLSQARRNLYISRPAGQTRRLWRGRR